MSKKLKRLLLGLLIGLTLGLLLTYFIAFTAPPAPDSGDPPHPDHKNLAAEIRQGPDQQYYYLNTNHHAYNRVLQAVVQEQGLVNYQTLAQHREKLDLYIHTAAYLDQQRFDQWSKQRQLAFWINMYNALTLQIVSEHYPIGQRLFGFSQNILGHNIPAGSIRQLPFMWTNTKFTVLNKKYSLDQIEHEILRPQFKEPRIHMAINCASIGCPPLRNEIYTEHALEQQLEEQTRLFLLHYPASKVTIDRERQTVSLSAILKWFATDFTAQNKALPGTYQSASNESERAVLVFISRYLTSEEANYLRDEPYTIMYRDYNWSLNDSSHTLSND